MNTKVSIAISGILVIAALALAATWRNFPFGNPVGYVLVTKSDGEIIQAWKFRNGWFWSPEFTKPAWHDDRYNPVNRRELYRAPREFDDDKVNYLLEPRYNRGEVKKAHGWFDLKRGGLSDASSK